MTLLANSRDSTFHAPYMALEVGGSEPERSNCSSKRGTWRPFVTTDEREEAVRAVSSYFLSLYIVISPSFSEAEMGREPISWQISQYFLLL